MDKESCMHARHYAIAFSINLILLFSPAAYGQKNEHGIDSCKFELIFKYEQCGYSGPYPKVTINCPIPYFKFSLYDRWGQLIYLTKDLDSLINLDIKTIRMEEHGTNATLQPGTYYWEVVYLTEGFDAVHKAMGTVTIF